VVEGETLSPPRKTAAVPEPRLQHEEKRMVTTGNDMNFSGGSDIVSASGGGDDLFPGDGGGC
jgi:hypothetical protein